MSDNIIPIFIGYDAREHMAFDVCRHSIAKRTSIATRIEPLVQQQLRERGLYRRSHHVLDRIMYDDQDGKPFSTEFAFTRFLVPELCNFEGWALFCDSDVLFLCDPAEILETRDEPYAVMVVKHNHLPEESVKMDGQLQEAYRRKNWSSMVLWNCGHPSNRGLDHGLVNNADGAFLHAFGWLKDVEIGTLPETYNWLAGVSPTTDYGREMMTLMTPPKVIHYTNGGPWFSGCVDVPYADLWLAEYADVKTNEYRQAVP